MEFYNCHISKQAIKNVLEVLHSGFLNQGSWVKRVEQCFQNEWNIPNPLTLNSCTSALHLALELCDVRGKEVILPAKTFIATGMAVLHAGGIPVFVDIDRTTGCPSFQNYISKIRDDTAAIIGVSWGGSTIICRTLYDVKCKTGLPVIEDAAHSFGTINKFRENIDFVCYSFQAIKMLTCGDGGLLSCKDKKHFLKARAMRWFGIDKEKMTFSENGERIFSSDYIGYKYNMNDLNASILSGNLDTMKNRLLRRRLIRQKYETYFRNEDSLLGEIELVSKSSGEGCSNWMFPLLVHRRDDFIKAMRSRGIPVTKTDSRIDINKVFGRKVELPNTDYYDAHEANLPCHEDLHDGEVEQVIDSIKKGW